MGVTGWGTRGVRAVHGRNMGCRGESRSITTLLAPHISGLYCVCMAAFIYDITDWIEDWMGPYKTPFIIFGVVVLAVAVGVNEWRTRDRR